MTTREEALKYGLSFPKISVGRKYVFSKSTTFAV